ncbi:hypothetical protein PSYJA_46656, partial [Pseudomonas syringae pv. japonica str. M301072]
KGLRGVEIRSPAVDRAQSVQNTRSMGTIGYAQTP